MNKKILLFGVLFFASCIGLGLTGCGKDEPVEEPKTPAVEVDSEPVVTPVIPDVPDKVVAPTVADPKAVLPKKTAETKALEDMMDKMNSGDDDMADVLAAMLAAGDKKNIQTMCPVMDGAIKKDIFVEYKGRKVYFCCPPCKTKFNAEPEKFLSKLPQFSK